MLTQLVHNLTFCKLTQIRPFHFTALLLSHNHNAAYPRPKVFCLIKVPIVTLCSKKRPWINWRMQAKLRSNISIFSLYLAYFAKYLKTGMN